MKRWFLSAAASLLLAVLLPAAGFSEPVSLICVSDTDYCSTELQRCLGKDFTVSTLDLESTMRALPDIVVVMKDFGDEYYWVIKRIRAIPSHPDIFICGAGEEFQKLASRAWTDLIPVDDFDDINAPDLSERIRKVVFANGWKDLPRRRIVFAGDSITDGAWGKGDSKPAAKRDHYDMNHIYGHGYAEKIASTLLERYPERNYKFYNRGIGGGKLQGLSERWDEEILPVKPDIISILIGVNDTNTEGDPVDYDAWEKTYRSLLDRTLERYPHCRFVLCTPFSAPRGDVVANSASDIRRPQTDRMDSIIRSIASDYDATVVDFAALIYELVGTDRSSDHNYWVWDGVHPTMPAHSKMAKLWIKKARKLI